MALPAHSVMLVCDAGVILMCDAGVCTNDSVPEGRSHLPHLEEAHPFEPLLLPRLGQAAAVQQAVHVPMAMRLGLQGKGV